MKRTHYETRSQADRILAICDQVVEDCRRERAHILTRQLIRELIGPRIGLRPVKAASVGTQS